MKKLQSSLLNMVLVLTGVAVVMGVILAYMNYLTSEPIAQQEKQALVDGIKIVMGGRQVQAGDKPDTIIAQTDTVKGKTLYYAIYNVKDSVGNAIGVAVQDTVNGFGGPLVVLTGFDNEGKILGYKILKQTETPGLGAKAEQWFQEGQKGSIIGLQPTADSLLTVTKQKPQNDKEVQAITASTITSRAFLLAVNNAYKAYRLSQDECCTEQPAECRKPCCQQPDSIPQSEPKKVEP